MPWTPTDKNLFFSRNDSEDPRLGEFVVTKSNQDKNLEPIWIWGYCDDEGISLNGGRPGAAEAPPVIRKFLYKMTPQQDFRRDRQCVDLGDLQRSGAIADRHEEGRIHAAHYFSQNGFCVSFGAGHDYAYSDGCGFLDANIAHNVRPIIVNFDAHLDVRPTTHGLNSGTAFRRILESKPHQFDFFEIGLQPQCNSQTHATWVQSQGGKILWLNELKSLGVQKCVEQLFGKLTPQQPLWISLDIDVFANHFAPGCSQAWGLGLSPEVFIEFCNELMKKFSLRGISIYEVSPPLDVDFRTSKLAALITYHFIHAFSRKGGTLHEGIWK